jgi:xylulokinase
LTTSSHSRLGQRQPDRRTPASGWSEQDPESWISATRAAIGLLAKTHAAELSKLRGIGLSGHMHGATTIDRAGNPIRPCILWNDTRSHVEAASLDADPMFRRLTGNIVFPGFTAPKLKWMAAHEPDNFARVARVLLPKDFLRLWLCGEAISEMSDSSGTSWLDVGKRDWDDDLLAATGLERSHMPVLVEGSERGGSCALNSPRNLACPRASRLPVVPVTMPLRPAAWERSLTVMLCLAGYIGRAVCRQQPLSAQSGQRRACLLSCAAGNLAPDGCDPVGNRFAQLAPASPRQTQRADRRTWRTLVAPGSVMFLPYLSGERTPHNDASIRGCFAGLGPRVRSRWR